jgi:hypothetical protein
VIDFDAALKLSQMALAFLIVPGILAVFKMNNSILQIGQDLLRLELKIGDKYATKDELKEIKR